MDFRGWEKAGRRRGRLTSVPHWPPSRSRAASDLRPPTSSGNPRTSTSSSACFSVTVSRSISLSIPNKPAVSPTVLKAVLGVIDVGSQRLDLPLLKVLQRQLGQLGEALAPVAALRVERHEHAGPDQELTVRPVEDVVPRLGGPPPELVAEPRVPEPASPHQLRQRLPAVFLVREHDPGGQVGRHARVQERLALVHE